MKKIIILTLLVMATAVNAQQNLSSMPEIKRNEYLIKSARDAVKKYAPDFCKYLGGGHHIEFIPKSIWSDFPEDFYSVRFLDYDINYEFFLNGHAVDVQFNAQSGIVRFIYSGSGWGIEIPQKTTRGQQVPRLEYKRVPTPMMNSDPHGKQTFY